jgi:hypothetical protein
VRAPTIVIASLSAIAITGLFFAIATIISGAGAMTFLFLSLPVAAASCLRVKRHSRTALFIGSLASMAPLMVGVMLSWPDIGNGMPYYLGIVTLFAGMAGMLSPEARAWHATESAHRLLDL